jgi:hypothetical protein
LRQIREREKEIKEKSEKRGKNLVIILLYSKKKSNKN